MVSMRPTVGGTPWCGTARRPAWNPPTTHGGLRWRRLRKTHGIVMAVLVAGVIAGCSTGGTVKQLTPADAPSLAGTWQGLISPPSGSNQSATLVVKPDGTYQTTAGAFSSTGKLEIVNGHVQFLSTGGTGGLATGSRSGSAVVMDRDRSWGLVGNGYAQQSGPFNFDFNKTK